ncbi:MAG: carbon-nitrogen hydrolase family protein [Candidatus Eremiobacteraeota bacterium]|nr:carbon-nitrogen hydrolase family protein [Candidatus Eremiobacteraeota bacterium]
MIRSVRVAAMQLRAHDRSDYVQSIERVVDLLRRTAPDVDVLVLPEATFPSYVLGKTPIREAISAVLDRLGEIAAASRTVIVAGAAADIDGATRNAAFVIDADGSLAGRADKLFLWHFDRQWFAPGERVDPIATSVGTLGVLVCADGRLPTIARALVDRGAQALIMPTAWVTSGRSPDALENVQADLLARVRAYENAVPFVAANKCGSELGMVAYCGKSQIVDSQGDIVAIAGEREPQTLRATIEIGGERPVRRSALRPTQRAGIATAGLRLAISYEPLPPDIDARLELLDDAYAVALGDEARFNALDRVIPAASTGDDVMLDPAALVAYRRAGYALICWATELGLPWSERLAQARALELRLYVIVFDRSRRRAFAVDPDGTIVAGTFDGFRIASFTFDPRKIAETLVAPGTDILEGFDRVASIVERTERAPT